MPVTTAGPAEIGGLVHRLRAERDMTQVQLAQAAGITERTIRRIEGGDLPARDRTYAKVAAALGLTLAELKGE